RRPIGRRDLRVVEDEERARSRAAPFRRPCLFAVTGRVVSSWVVSRTATRSRRARARVRCGLVGRPLRGVSTGPVRLLFFFCCFFFFQFFQRSWLSPDLEASADAALDERTEREAHGGLVTGDTRLEQPIAERRRVRRG